MQLIIVRGASGIVSWSPALVSRNVRNWICNRDQFVVPGPTTPAESEQTAIGIVQHSASLVGAVSQVVQLEL